MSFADENDDYGQHEYASIIDLPGRLERQLRVYVSRGRRVLDFWRARGRWVFKLMATLEREDLE